MMNQNNVTAVEVEVLDVRPLPVEQPKSTAVLCGARATREQVFALNPPEHTQSWKPVAYRDAIGRLGDSIRMRMGREVIEEQFSLNKAGTQLFYVARVDVRDDEQGLSIALRQSYDKSLALGVAAGSHVFVCDNLMFNGDAFTIMRKNTTNVWEDFTNLINGQVELSRGAFEEMQRYTAQLKQISCNKRKGYATLGVMRGEGILTPTQASVAYSDWDEPRHEEFGDRNLWGLYNATTEALKSGNAGGTIDRHVKAHGWFENLLS